MSRRLAAAMAAAMAAGSLVAPAAPAAAKTTVGKPTKDGRIPITVSVDIAVPKTAKVPNEKGKMVPPAEYWKEAAQGIWNDAFGRLPYKNCYRFELKVDAKTVAPADPVREGRHMVFWRDGSGGSVAREPGQTGPTPFDHSQNGIFGKRNSPRVIAHEFGHYLGLPDDYDVISKNPRIIRPKPSRQNTLMADLGPIDQVLIDRIGEQLERRGLLPQCWKGNIVSQTTRVYSGIAEGHIGTCTDAWDSELSLVVVGDGTVTGEGTARLSEGPVCTGRIGPGFGTMTECPLAVEGTTNADGFQLRLSVGDDGCRPTLSLSFAGNPANYATYGGGVVAGPGPFLDIPKTGPCTARGTVTVEDPVPSGGDPDPFTSINTIELECVPDSDLPVG